MTREVEQSYRHCRAVARSRAKNFYYSFLLLSREKRDAMSAVYAFMRHADDLSDEPGAAREPLERWRETLDRALAGDFGGHPVLPAFHDTVSRYRIPAEYFHEMIDGVSSDLEPRRVQTFEELYGYCYQVASVVGMTTVHILGFDDPTALLLAEKCGVAFQLTNILRDVREDLERGRVYIPLEDLERFGVEGIEPLYAEPAVSPASPPPGGLSVGRGNSNRSKAGLAAPPADARFTELMRFEAARARAYYKESEPLLQMIHPSSRRALWALIEIYSRLLEKIEASGYDVLSRRIRLSTMEKVGIVAKAALK